MVLVINRMVLTALILGSITGSVAQIATPITEEGLGATTCYPFTCKTSKQTFTSETCVYYDTASATFYSEDSACTAAGKVCSEGAQALANYTCTAAPATVASAKVGEYCSTLADCVGAYSSACTNNVCVSAYKDSCLTGGLRDDLWCPAGQYCSVTTTAGVTTGTCVAQVKVGGACMMNWDCVSNAYCSIAAGAAAGTAGTCVALFSISSGKPDVSCAATTAGTYAQSLFCESTLCGPVKGAGTCLDTVKSDDSVPVKCTTLGNNSPKCLSKKDSVSDMQLMNTCVCGFNKAGDAYCDLNPGDSHFQSYLKYTKKWLSSSGISKCNTEGRLDALCQKAQWDKSNIQAWTYYSMLLNNYPVVTNVEDCVLSNLAVDYKAAKDAYDSSAAFFTLSALVLAAFA